MHLENTICLTVSDRAKLPGHSVNQDPPVTFHQGVCKDVWVHLPPTWPDLWDAKLQGGGGSSSHSESLEVKMMLFLVFGCCVYATYSLIYISSKLFSAYIDEKWHDFDVKNRCLGNKICTIKIKDLIKKVYDFFFFFLTFLNYFLAFVSFLGKNYYKKTSLCFLIEGIHLFCPNVRCIQSELLIPGLRLWLL